jgi:hypothetical protein
MRTRQGDPVPAIGLNSVHRVTQCYRIAAFLEHGKSVMRIAGSRRGMDTRNSKLVDNEPPARCRLTHRERNDNLRMGSTPKQILVFNTSPDFVGEQCILGDNHSVSRQLARQMAHSMCLANKRVVCLLMQRLAS